MNVRIRLGPEREFVDVVVASLESVGIASMKSSAIVASSGSKAESFRGRWPGRQRRDPRPPPTQATPETQDRGCEGDDAILDLTEPACGERSSPNALQKRLVVAPASLTGFVRMGRNPSVMGSEPRSVTGSELRTQLILGQAEGGPRQFLDGQPVHVGATLELLLDNGRWITVGYEWTWQPDALSTAHVALGVRPRARELGAADPPTVACELTPRAILRRPEQERAR